MPRSEPTVPYRISLGVGSGALLQPLNSSMIAVALVTIGDQLGIESGISWLISGLYLATTVGAPLAGRVADLYGPRLVFLAGLVLVAIGAAIGPLFPSLPGLIVSRVLLGLGAASQFPAAMAIIRARAARHREDATRALAVLGVCAQVSIALGPLLGGLLVTGLGWQAVFWVNLPLSLVAGLWVWRVGPPDPPHERSESSRLGRVDLPGAVLFAAALCGLMLYLLSLAGGQPWWDEWWWLLLAVLSGTGWVARERRAGTPFVDLRIFSRRPLLGVVLLRQLLVSTVFFSVFYALPQWLEEGRGLDPRGAGLLLMPIALVGALATVLATRLLRGGQAAWVLVAGALGLVGAGLLLGFGIGAATPLGLVVVLTAALGVPNGFTFLGNQNEVYALSAEQVGAASGLLRTSHFLGAMVSAGLIEVLSAGTYDDRGLHRVGLGITLVATALLVVTLLGLRLRRPSPGIRATDPS